MIDLLGYGFMQRALLASLMVGLLAPAVGVFLVQRRLSLLGDGLGHVALTGVAVIAGPQVNVGRLLAELQQIGEAS